MSNVTIPVRTSSSEFAEEQEEEFCCNQNKQLLLNDGFVHTLKISPPIIIFTKSVKNASYLKCVEIQNDFEFPRKFKIETHFPPFIAIKNLPAELILLPNIPIQFEIYYEPVAKLKPLISRRYYFKLISTHPNCVIEVPVLVLLGPPTHDVSNTPVIAMKNSSPGIESYYLMKIYNPFKDNLNFNFKNTTGMDQFIHVKPKNGIVESKSYIEILLKTLTIKECSIETDIYLKFNNSPSIISKIKVYCEIKPYNLYVKKNMVEFNEIPLGLRSEETLLVCNESYDEIWFKWSCRPEKFSLTTEETNIQNEDENVIEINDQFSIKPKFGSIEPFSSKEFAVMFDAPKEITDVTTYPHKFMSKAFLGNSSDSCHQTIIKLFGTAIGANIEFLGKNFLNFGTTFVGEMRCELLKFKNTGKIEGLILFESFDSVITAFCNVEPKEIALMPNEEGEFLIEYFTSTLGEYLDKLIFQIKYGVSIPVYIRGTSVPIKLNTQPEKIVFERAPICIPQKQYLTVSNPLSVPIIFKCQILNDGLNPPLVLNVNLADWLKSSKSFISSKTCGYKSNEQQKNQEYKGEENNEIKSTKSNFSFWIKETDLQSFSENELKSNSGSTVIKTFSDIVNILYSSSDSISDASETTLSVETICSNCSDVSQTIEPEFEGDIPELMNSLLKRVKLQKLINYNEADLNVIKEVFELFRNSKHFEELKECENFLNAIWDLPCNPQQYSVDSQSIYLEPNESTQILIVWTPNISGSSKEILEIQAYPDSNFLAKPEPENFFLKIDAKFITSKIEIFQRCSLPIIELENDCIAIEAYVEKKEKFEITLKNTVDLPGFVEIKIISKDDVSIYFSPRKFLILPLEIKTLKVLINPQQTGMFTLKAFICVLGKQQSKELTIICQVKPPELVITPNKFLVTQNVVDRKMHRMFLENISPTIARFFIKLKNDVKYFDIYPLGGILGPGQCVLIEINTCLYDPRIYLNAVEIYLIHYGPIEIPMTFYGEGLPIRYSDANIDFSTVFISKISYTRELVVTNYGEKEYGINIVKLKDQKLTSFPLEFNIEPNVFTMGPESEMRIIISICCDRKKKLQKNYSIICINDKSKKFELGNITISIRFIVPQLMWSKEKLFLNGENTDNSPYHKISETVYLTNPKILATLVELNVMGNFKIVIDGHLRTEKTHYVFTMNPKEIRKFLIVFDDYLLEENQQDICYIGRILTNAEKIMQGNLELEAILTYPSIKICKPNQLYYCRKTKFYSRFCIMNNGSFECFYKWKLLSEKCFNLGDIAAYKELNISEIVFSKPCSMYLDRQIDLEREYEKCEDIIDTDEEISDTEIKNTIYEEPKKINKKLNGSSKTIDNIEKIPSCKRKSRTSIQNKSRASKKISVEETKSVDKLESKPMEDPIVYFEEILEEIGNYLNLKPNVEAADELESFENNECSISDEQNDLLEESNKFIFDHYEGSLDSDQSKIVNLFFDKTDTYSNQQAYGITYQLEVIGGKNSYLNLTVCDFNPKILITKTKFIFGRQHWYKKFNLKIKISNPTLLKYKIATIDSESSDFINGYVKSLCNSCFCLDSMESCVISIEAFMGFSPYFEQQFGIEINNTVPVPILLQGYGLIPNLSVLNIERPSLFKLDVDISYRALEFMFKKHVADIVIRLNEYSARDVTFFLIYLAQFNEEGTNERSASISESMKNDKSYNVKKILSVCPLTGKIFEKTKYSPNFGANLIQSMDPEVSSFEVIDYPEEYPSDLEIEENIRLRTFLNNLNQSKDDMQQFCRIIKKTLFNEENEIFFYKKFIIRALPFKSVQYEFDMEDILLNEINCFEIELYFHGPGKFFLSARTDIVIPNFQMEFISPKITHLNKKNTESVIFLVNSMEHENNEPYRNKSQREEVSCTNEIEKCENCVNCEGFCAECKTKECHPHSYDFNCQMVHKREKISRIEVCQHYSKLSRNKEEKPNYILSEIFQNDSVDYSNTKLKLQIRFRPNNSLFYSCQVFEEYFYIDVHLGPTVPVLLKGKFVSSSLIEECSETNKIF